MNIVKLHQLIDQWAAEERDASSEEVNPEVTVTEAVVEAEPARVLPEGKRLVRTKSSGDTVYFIDTVKGTRQRIVGSQANPGPQIVESLGFNMADVEEVADDELLKYQMASVIYKPVDVTA